mgnify:FL=1
MDYILGDFRQHDYKKAANSFGNSTLSSNGGWTLQANIDWLMKGVQDNATFYLVTSVDDAIAKFGANANRKTLGFELLYLQMWGYKPKWKPKAMMVPPMNPGAGPDWEKIFDFEEPAECLNSPRGDSGEFDTFWTEDRRCAALDILYLLKGVLRIRKGSDLNILLL